MRRPVLDTFSETVITTKRFHFIWELFIRAEDIFKGRWHKRAWILIGRQCSKLIVALWRTSCEVFSALEKCYNDGFSESCGLNLKVPRHDTFRDFCLFVLNTNRNPDSPLACSLAWFSQTVNSMVLHKNSMFSPVFTAKQWNIIPSC